MKNINRILLQLNKAIECANSSYSQERALAVIILDNIAELYLYHYLRNIILAENSININKSHISFENIDDVLCNHSKLLKLGCKYQVIDKSQKEVLSLAHEIRNALYHKGDFYDEKNIDLALSLFYELYKSTNINLISPSFLVALSGDFQCKPINFGQLSEKEYSQHEYKEYFNEAYNFIINKWKLKYSFKTLSYAILSKKIRDIKYYLKDIKQNGNILFKTLIKDYKNNSKNENLNILLSFELFKRKCVNIPKANCEAKKYVSDFKQQYKTKKYPHSVNLSNLSKKLSNFKNQDFQHALQVFVNMSAYLENLYKDSKSADSELEYEIDKILNFDK